jgi:hypothetical protein
MLKMIKGQLNGLIQLLCTCVSNKKSCMSSVFLSVTQWRVIQQILEYKLAQAKTLFTGDHSRHFLFAKNRMSVAYAS